MTIRSSFLCISALLLSAAASAATGGFDFSASRWHASWIQVPGTDPQGYGVYHFRKTFPLEAAPGKFVVFVSGDNRYQLYVNGVLVSWGPARSDLYHWRYEVVDVGSKLHAGTNVFAAVVWNDGPFRAVAQNTNQSAFLLQAEDPDHWFVDTGKSWKCIEDKAYSPLHLPPNQMIGYQAIGANEVLNAKLFPWGWESPAYDDAAWQQAAEISRGAARDSQDAPNRWMLVPRFIPLEEMTLERIATVRRSDGITPPAGFPGSVHPFNVPQHSHVSLLLDQTYLTTAYPELTVSGGEGSKVTLRYAESLYEPQPAGVHSQPLKGNRNEIEGKVFYGREDMFLPDGGQHRAYRPLFWRTYRYLELTIDTTDSPLALEDIHGLFTAYPFARTARITVSDPAVNEEIQQILSTGWRTARLCAHETYMDCPYYEQLQYAGDARIQMLVSLFMTGDSRLMQQGIEALNSSRTAEGATYSRAPSNLQQYIPPFSLWWIGMVHDYWMYVDDPAFVKSMLPGVQAVLSFFANHQKSSGSLNRLPWWNFVDWTRTWHDGVPPADPDGSSSAAIDLQLLLAYRWAADLENGLGNRLLGQQYAETASDLQNTILQSDWDAVRGLFADQPSHRTYSQQVNTLAVLAGLKEKPELKAIVEKLLSDPSLEKSSIYFRAYTNATLREVGLGNQYLANLDAWRAMLSQGLTTWAETDMPDTRSDCHAWGASPNFEIFRTLAGIDSAGPGFHMVRIAPNVGKLKHISAAVPHAGGDIRVDITNGNRFTADVVLPPGTTGEFIWKDANQPLHPGQNRVTFSSPSQ